MQQLELSQNARKLIMSCPFSDVGCPFMIASIINFFCDIAVGSWKHSSTSRNSFTSTSLLTLSDQLQDLSLMSLGLEILRQSDTVSKPSAMLLPLSEMPCLEASGKVIPFSPSKLLWSLIYSSSTFSVMMLLVSVFLTFDGDADWWVYVYSCKLVLAYVWFF